MSKYIKGDGYETIVACENCNSEYCKIDGATFIDGKGYCNKCFPKLEIPFFVKNVPAFCEGCPTTIFTFNTPEEFFNKIKTRLTYEEILVSNGDHILALNTKKFYWWVLGGINNYDVKKINIPNVCGYLSKLYNDKGYPNKEVFEKIIKGKTIISGKGE